MSTILMGDNSGHRKSNSTPVYVLMALPIGLGFFTLCTSEHGWRRRFPSPCYIFIAIVTNGEQLSYVSGLILHAGQHCCFPHFCGSELQFVMVHTQHGVQCVHYVMEHLILFITLLRMHPLHYTFTSFSASASLDTFLRMMANALGSSRRRTFN